MPDGQRDWKITEMELWECLQRYRELSLSKSRTMPTVYSSGGRCALDDVSIRRVDASPFFWTGHPLLSPTFSHIV